MKISAYFIRFLEICFKCFIRLIGVVFFLLAALFFWIIINQNNFLHIPIYFKETISRPWPSASPTPLPMPSPSASPITFTPQPTPNQNQVNIQTAGISQSSLWQAVTNYRTSHSRNPLVQEESLCTYARKRVIEHLNRFQGLSEGEAPLDNHDGFNRDAQSGSIFSETGFSRVAEVLAFLPQATTATQVIEWGWDSSPSHREGILSNDSTHACFVGTSPFFVGILGSR